VKFVEFEYAKNLFQKLGIEPGIKSYAYREKLEKSYGSDGGSVISTDIDLESYLFEFTESGMNLFETLEELLKNKGPYCYWYHQGEQLEFYPASDAQVLQKLYDRENEYNDEE